MTGDIEKPKIGERHEDGAERVNQGFKAEGAAVGIRRHVSGEKRLFYRGADAASEPRGGTPDEDMIGVRRERERSRRKGRESIAKDGQWFAALQPIGEMAGGEF